MEPPKDGTDLSPITDEDRAVMEQVLREPDPNDPDLMFPERENNEKKVNTQQTTRKIPNKIMA
jgi:hypothetical protein